MNSEYSILVTIGFLTGAAATVAVILVQGAYRQLKGWLRYRWLRGTYQGFGYKKGTAELSQIPQSRATIKKGYKNIFKQNCFTIMVEHGIECTSQWEGDLTLYADTNNYGVVVWKYIKRPIDKKNELLFGFKRCHLNPREKWFYLQGEIGSGYGVEAFEQISKKRWEKLKTEMKDPQE